MDDDDDAPENLPLFNATWHKQPPAMLLMQAGQWLQPTEPEQALKYFEAAQAVDASLSIAAWRAGQVCLELGRHADARRHLERALELTPEHVPTRHLLGVAHAGMGDFEGALAHANGALAENPAHGGAFLEKLRALTALERWRELQSVCEAPPPNLQPSHERALWHALALAELGEIDAAQAVFAGVATRIRRRYPEAARRIEQIVGRG